MPLEIERKFLVQNETWRQSTSGIEIQQGYLCPDPERSVRIRIAGLKAKLTIKGKSSGIVRQEFEYDIPMADAHALLKMCSLSLISKTRYQVHEQGHDWDIDVFHGDNQGLIIAEVELEWAHQDIDAPAWVGEEISHDTRYYNLSLARDPYVSW